MTRADQLRQALDIIDAERAHEQISGYVTEESPIIDAARCWLRLQEADEQNTRQSPTIDQIAKALIVAKNRRPYPTDLDLARAVLAAITEEEK